MGNTYFQGTLDDVDDGIAYLTMSTSIGTHDVWVRVDKILAVLFWDDEIAAGGFVGDFRHNACVDRKSKGAKAVMGSEHS